jgi:hypothetical protein
MTLIKHSWNYTMKFGVVSLMFNVNKLCKKVCKTGENVPL